MDYGIDCPPPSIGSVPVASEIRDDDLSSYRGILLDIFPGGRGRVQPFGPGCKWGKVGTVTPSQLRELIDVEGRTRG